MVGLMGCGGSTDSPGATATPTVHSIDSGNKRVNVNTSLAIGPFSLPAGATVTYAITDMPTGIGNDTMNVAVVTDAMIQSGATALTGYSPQNGVSSPTGTTMQLPADSYDFWVFCNNLADDCLFSDTVTAFY